MSIHVTRQITVHLEKSGERMVALWTEYEYRGGLRHEVFVMMAVPTLLPPGRIGQRFIASGRDVDAEQLRGWLESRGFRIVATASSSEPTARGAFRTPGSGSL